MKKPLIVISGGIERYESGLFSGHHRVFAVANYSESILRAGGVPIIVPPTMSFEPSDYVDEILETADGLLLTGGNDVDPFLYGEEPHPKLGELMIQKDRMEFALLDRAFARGIPIFGICRGLQILNVYLGGTLYQDLSEHPDVRVLHEYRSDLSIAGHSVNTVKGSQLNTIFGDEYRVNSAHHQIIKNLAPDLMATAHAKDGVIEGIEHKIRSNVFAVQWHPEMMSRHDSKMAELFQVFVRLCQKEPL